MFVIQNETKGTYKGKETTSISYLKSVYTSKYFNCFEHTLNIDEAIKFKAPKYAEKYLKHDKNYKLVEVK